MAPRRSEYAFQLKGCATEVRLLLYVNDSRLTMNSKVASPFHYPSLQWSLQRPLTTICASLHFPFAKNLVMGNIIGTSMVNKVVALFFALTLYNLTILFVTLPSF